MKPNHRTHTPERLLFLDTETDPKKVSETETRHTMKLGCTCYMRKSRSKKKQWYEEWKFHYKPSEILKYIDSLLIQKKALYIVGSNLLFDLLAIGFMEHYTRKKYKLGFCYSGGMSFILTCRKNKSTLKCISTQNYAPISVKQMGEVIGLKKMEIDFANATIEQLEPYCRRDTDIIRRFMVKYLRFIEEKDMGNFSYTRAAQSLALYRHRFMAYPIEIHTHEKASTLEQQSYYGGRCECFKIGDFTGKDITCLDVNSMYPYVMEKNNYPCKMVDYSEHPSITHVRHNINKLCYVAHVTVKTDIPIYPIREKQKIIFPVGQFETYLCTPSLKFGLQHGHIKAIHKLATYESAPIFRDYVQEMYPLKVQYKKEGKPVWSEMVKYLLNSLYGKWGQQREKIVSDSKIASDTFSREEYYEYETKKHYIIQCLFHRKQIFHGKEPTSNTFFAIPAHVTDYARLYLWQLMKRVYPKYLYYTDTDSLMIASNKVHLFKDCMDKYKLGALDIQKRSKRVIIHGPKDYVFGEDVKIKGIRKNAEKLSDNVFRQDYFPSLKRIMKEKQTGAFPVYKVTKTLKRIYEKGVVTPSGNVVPFHYPI